jgi:glycerol-3-phosphate dehydrogenase
MKRLVAHALSEQPFDVVVVGAGINGAGIARDAALRGLRVLLVDKGDIGGATTSWSTRLIHGGLRYLEHREVSLVRESLRERERLLRIAPHLVRPLPFMVPVYEHDKRGLNLIRLGMLGYETLSFDKSLPRHRMLSRERALQRAPGLAPEGLRGAALYYDAQSEFPERLAVENALSAHDHGAHVLTYHAVERCIVEHGRVAGVHLRDIRTGATTVARAALTLNVAGPWVDEVLRGVTGLPERRYIGGTKGTHIVVDAFPGAPATALYVEASDGRPYFIVPWNDLFLIGTTDTRYEGDLDRVEATEDEIEYLVTNTNRLIPSAGLTREKVLYTYAGVRPLPEVQAGAEAAITRRHIVHDHAPDVHGLLSIVGGKLTTYRELAEQAVDLALRKLGRPRRPSRTGDVGLPGGALGNPDEYAREFECTAGLSGPVARRLLRLYGSCAGDVLALAREEPVLGEIFDPVSNAIGAEVVYALQTELATTLQDVLLRRTVVALGPRAGLEADRAAAAVAVRHAGWDEARADSEVAAFRERMRVFHPLGGATGART